MGSESFRSLLNLARAKVAGNYLTKDPNIIGIIMKKTLKVKPSANDIFLEELTYLLKFQRNIEILWNSDLTFEFLHRCLTNPDISKGFSRCGCNS